MCQKVTWFGRNITIERCSGTAVTVDREQAEAIAANALDLLAQLTAAFAAQDLAEDDVQSRQN